MNPVKSRNLAIDNVGGFFSQITMFGRNIARTTFTRAYHSFYHVNPEIVSLKTVENQILNRAYEKYVPQYGFNRKAIEHASRDLGINGSASSNAIFNFTSESKDLKMELILFHLKKCRQELDNLRKSEEFQETMKGLSETEKLRSLIHFRLGLNKPIIKHLPNALGYMILGGDKLVSSLRELHNLSDDITYYAGDRSIDFAWYSKRVSISGLIIQSELFMINDKSLDFEDTFRFVDSKLKEIETAAYVYNSIEEWLFFNGVSLVNIVKSQLSRG